MLEYFSKYEMVFRSLCSRSFSSPFQFRPHCQSISSTSAYSAKIATLLPKEARNNGKLGVVVKSLTSGETIFEHNAQNLFIPASNEKIITSVASLSLLKRDYRFKTEFYSGGGISKGMLHGGLYVKGYGDPTLGEPHLGFIVYEIKKRGIKEIKDGITVDDSYFSRTRRAEGWKEEWTDDFYSPPISALSFNYNTIEVKVTSSKSGQKPTITILPEGSNIAIVNNAVTSSKQGVLTTTWKDEQTIIVGGRIRSKSSVLLKIPVQNPTLLTGNILKNALEEAGIKVIRTRRSGRGAEMGHRVLHALLGPALLDNNRVP